MFHCLGHVKWYGTGVARTCAPADPAALSISTPSPSDISIPFALHHLPSTPDFLPLIIFQPIPSTTKQQQHSTTTTNLRMPPKNVPVASVNNPHNAHPSPTSSQTPLSAAQRPHPVDEAVLAAAPILPGRISLGRHELNRGTGLNGKDKAPDRDLRQSHLDSPSNDRSRDQSRKSNPPSVRPNK